MAGLVPYVRSVRTVTLPRARGAANAARLAPFSRDPLQVLYFRSREFADHVRELGRQADVVHAFFHRTAPAAFAAGPPVVLELMDSLVLRLEHYVQVATPPKRWVYAEELRRMREYEPAVARRADHVIVVSERDRPYFPGADVTVVENGVDTELFAPDPARRRADAIVFSGNMGYEPNVDAARWFVAECFGRIRAQVPTATLSIVGARPTRAVRELADRPGVAVTGFVDSMPAALNEATVAVAPLRSGSGIQNKILEAMACGLSIVATPTAVGAIDAHHGRDIVVAEGAESFADAVVRVLRDASLREALARNARTRVVESYSWARGAERVEEIWNAAVSGRSSSPSP